MATVSVFHAVETAPLLLSREKNMLRFLEENPRYPPEAKTKGIHGLVVVSFILEKKGSLTNLKVKPSLNSQL